MVVHSFHNHLLYVSPDRESATPPASREQRRQPASQIPFYKIEGSMTWVVRSAPQYPARNPQLGILDPIALHERPTEPFRMRA
jgi:hypothetical protein